MKKFIPAIVVLLFFAAILLPDSSRFSKPNQILLSEDFSLPSDGFPAEELAADGAEELPLSAGENARILYLFEDSVVYLLHGKEEETLLQYSFATGEIRPVATLAFYQMNAGASAFAEVNGSLYFYTFGPGNIAIDVAGFYELDLAQGQLLRRICTAPYPAFVSQAVADGKIYAVKGITSTFGKKITFCVEEYDPKSGKQKRILKTAWDEKNGTGEQFVRIFFRDGEFWVLVARHNSGTVEYRLDVYGADWKRLRTVDLSGLNAELQPFTSCEILGEQIFVSTKNESDRQILTVASLADPTGTVLQYDSASLSEVGSIAPETRLLLDKRETTPDNRQLLRLDENGQPVPLEFEPFAQGGYRCEAVYQCGERVVLKYQRSHVCRYVAVNLSEIV